MKKEAGRGSEGREGGRERAREYRGKGGRDTILSLLFLQFFLGERNPFASRNKIKL